MCLPKPIDRPKGAEGRLVCILDTLSPAFSGKGDGLLTVEGIAVFAESKNLKISISLGRLDAIIWINMPQLL